MTDQKDQPGLSRRALFRDAAVGGVAISLAGPAALQARPRRPRRRSVAVIGGGMAGLAAAHELAERGFKVTVFEKHRFGGKARSMPVPRTAAGGRRPLPGEHGFRFFPGFYHHVPNTMRRIPTGTPNGVADAFVSTPEVRLSRAGAADVILPVDPAAYGPESFAGGPGKLVEALLGGTEIAGQVPPHELAFFSQRMGVFFSSCDERRYGHWEHVPWIEFVRPEGKSEAYRKYVVKFATRAVVAAKEEVASTRTIGNMAEAFLLGMVGGRGFDGAADRLLNAPTNEAWIYPWMTHLRELGVEFHQGWSVDRLRTSGGRIAAARVRRSGESFDHYDFEADWFVAAAPAERARKLWDKDILALDPALELMDELFVDWMVGLQFFLRRQVTLAEGHVAYVDAPWALTSISQAHFWDRDFPSEYGDGSVHDCLSVDISDWDTPGILYGKPAKLCTKEEVAKEVWEQIKAHVNDTGTALRDDDLHSWFLDPGVSWSRKRRRNINATPLLVNTIGTWEKRPRARMEIPNLFHAGDHVQTDIDLATMEGANESARAAVNALLDASGSGAERAEMFTLYDPPEFEAAKRIDQERYRAGRPNLLDT